MSNDINDSDIESALTSAPDHIESPPRRSKRNCTKRVLYPCQIVYGPGPFLKVNSKAPEVGQSSSSANFISSHTAKSHVPIVPVLRMLSSNVDNGGVDEPASLKEAMSRHDWPE